MSFLVNEATLHDIFNVLNGKKHAAKNMLYSARLSFRMEGKIKSTQDKQKLKASVNTEPALQEILKGIL